MRAAQRLCRDPCSACCPGSILLSRLRRLSRLGTFRMLRFELCAFVACRDVREERRGHRLVSAPGHRKALLPSGASIDQRLQQGKRVGQILEHALEVPFEPGDPRSCLCAGAVPHAVS